MTFSMEKPSGHCQDDFVATIAADQRQSDARVTSGGLKNSGSWLEQAFSFGAPNHSQSSAVLDAAAGVEILKLGVNVSTVCGNNFAKVENGGLTDQFGDLLGHP